MRDNEFVYNLIKEHEHNLSGLCFALCRNHADADDLYQDTWVKVIKNLDKYDKSRSFNKWLNTICINTFKNAMKHKKVSNALDFQTNEEAELFFSNIPDNSVPKEDYMDLNNVISQLSGKYRVILALRFFNEYTEREIAEVLKIPIGTVKSRLSKAKKLLQERISC